MTKDEAIVALGLQGTLDPKGALRKRLNNGASAKRVYVDGEEMVQLIAEVDPELMTFDEAMNHFSYYGADGRSALRKRLKRGKTAELVMANGVEMVRITDNNTE
jgi:hypothetical protein